MMKELAIAAIVAIVVIGTAGYVMQGLLMNSDAMFHIPNCSQVTAETINLSYNTTWCQWNSSAMIYENKLVTLQDIQI